MIKVEKGIPIPTTRLRRGRHVGHYYRPIYPWQLMEVGDSFLIETSGDKTSFAMMLVNRAAWQRGKATGEKYTTRAVIGGVRTWRVR